MLGGNSIEDLETLLGYVGGPTVFAPNGRMGIRDCNGLRQAGYQGVDHPAWHEQLVVGGLAWLAGLRSLLYESREELATHLDAPLLPGRGGTLREMLAWYGRELEDFD